MTVPIELVQPYSLRPVRAPDGAAGPAWRIDFLSWHPDGIAIPESACP